MLQGSSACVLSSKTMWLSRKDEWDIIYSFDKETIIWHFSVSFRLYRWVKFQCICNILYDLLVCMNIEKWLWKWSQLVCSLPLVFSLMLVGFFFFLVTRRYAILMWCMCLTFSFLFSFFLFFWAFLIRYFLHLHFQCYPKSPHTPPPPPTTTHSLFLALAFPCTEAYKVCKTNGPLFPMMAD
jgi:hypothetical protein